MPDEHGVTHKQRVEGLLSRAKDGKRRATLRKEIELPPFPAELDYLWTTFWRLRGRVNGSGFGRGRITWLDIDAFCRFSRMTLTPWEVQIIEMLDDALLAVGAVKNESDTD